MSTLKGKSPKDTFGGLLKLESGSLDNTLKQVEDGFGVATPLKVSKTTFSIHDLAFPNTNATPGYVLAVSADGTAMEWVESGAGSSSEPTAKGTIKVSDGSTQIDLPIGNNGQVLMADSTKPGGVKWGTVASGGGGGASEVVESAEYTYTADNEVYTVTEHIGENVRVSTYTYTASGETESITTEYMGVTRVETYTYVNGQVSTMTSTYL